MKNIVLSYSGQFIYISGNTGDYNSYYSNQNPTQFIRSGDISSTYATITNLGLTGSNAYNNSLNLSGNLTLTGQTLNNLINGSSKFKNPKSLNAFVKNLA